MVSDRDTTTSLTVVAAVIRAADGRVLLTKRPLGSHMGGLWEFPGGKVDAGEAPHDALARELREELGLEVRVERPITFAVHEEPGLRILLLFYAVQIVYGEPRGREGQAVKWVSVTDLPSYPTPPADAEIVRLLAEEP